MEGIIREFSRMRSEGKALRDELPRLGLPGQGWPERLAAGEAAETDIVAHRPAAAVA
jgi:hypothetical protein